MVFSQMLAMSLNSGKQTYETLTNDEGVCIPKFNVDSLFCWHLDGLLFYLESIGVR